MRENETYLPIVATNGMDVRSACQQTKAHGFCFDLRVSISCFYDLRWISTLLIIIVINQLDGRKCLL